jgi:hypothetical protein
MLLLGGEEMHPITQERHGLDPSAGVFNGQRVEPNVPGTLIVERHGQEQGERPMIMFQSAKLR